MSCSTFYVYNQATKEQCVLRLVINHKPLHKDLQMIRYPIFNRKDLLGRLYDTKIFSNDMKSNFWQICTTKKDRHKATLTVPSVLYKWNVIQFGLKNAPSEFQHILNDIPNNIPNNNYEFSIVLIDDVLIYSKNLDQHLKHLKTFFYVKKRNSLVMSAPK